MARTTTVAAGVRHRIVLSSIAVLPVQETIIKIANATTEELSLEVIPRLLETGITHVLVHDITNVHREKVLLKNDAVKLTTTICRDAIENTRDNEEDTQVH